MLTQNLRSWQLVLVISSLAGPAFSQTSRDRCPSGQRPSLSGCVDGSSQARVRVRPEARAKATGPKPVPKPDPELTVERAKPKTFEQKSKSLLIQELVRLESMLKTTPSASPDHPVILKRLADGYAELEMITERERARSQAAADAEEQAARELEKQRKPKKRGQGTLL